MKAKLHDFTGTASFDLLVGTRGMQRPSWWSRFVAWLLQRDRLTCQAWLAFMPWVRDYAPLLLVLSAVAFQQIMQAHHLRRERQRRHEIRMRQTYGACEHCGCTRRPLPARAGVFCPNCGDQPAREIEFELGLDTTDLDIALNEAQGHMLLFKKEYGNGEGYLG